MPANDGVPALVESVREHKRFKQLAIYSIECVSKVICLPNSNWRKNVQIAADCGAAKCCIEALRIHAGKEDVVRACLDCLLKLGVDPINADLIATEGGVEALLESIQGMPNVSPDILSKIMKLLEILCGHSKALQKLVDKGSIYAVLQFMRQYAANDSVLGASIRALEKLTRTMSGIDGFIQGGGLPIMLQALTRFANIAGSSTEIDDIMLSGTMTLVRSLKDEAIIEQFREAGGVDFLMRIMSVYASHEGITRACAKIMSRVCGNSVEQVLATLRSGGLSQEAMEHYLSLLASLAADADMSDEIFRLGGIAAVIASFQGRESAVALEALARTIMRLATSAENVAELVRAGAIATLIRALMAGVGTPEAIAAAIDALTKIATTGTFAHDVVECHGVAVVMSVLATNSSSSIVCAAAVRFLEAISQSDIDLSSLLDQNGVAWIIHALNSNANDIPLQISGTRTLLTLASSAEKVHQLVASGAPALALRNMTHPDGNAELVKYSMFLASSMMLTSAGAEAIRAAGGFDAIVSAIIAYFDNPEIRQAAMEIVELLSSSEAIQSKVRDVIVLANKARENKLGAADFGQIPKLAKTIGVLAMIPSNVAKIVEFGGITPISALITAISEMSSCQNQEDILSSLTKALYQLVFTGGHTFGNEEAMIQGAVSILNCHSKQTLAVIDALKLLNIITSTMPRIEICAQLGVIEAVATGLRAQIENEEVVGIASKVLMNLSRSESLAVDLAKLNATRQVINALTRFAEVSTSSMLDTHKNMLKVLENVGSTKEGRSIAGKQGAINAVYAVLSGLSTHPDIVEACVRVIALFSSPEDVLAVLQKIRTQFTAQFIKSATPEQLALVTLEINKLSLLLCCGDYLELIQANGGLETLCNIMMAAQTAQACRERTDLLSSCLVALGRAAVNAIIPNAASLVPMIAALIRDFPTADGVRAVGFLARDPHALSLLCATDIIQQLLRLCQTASGDPALVKAAFQSLVQIGKDPAGARLIAQLDGTRFVIDYIKELLYAGKLDSMVDAMALLSALGRAAGIQVLLQNGISGLISEILNSLSSQPINIDAMLSLLSLMTTVSGQDVGVLDMMSKNLFGKLVTLLDRRAEYLKDPLVVHELAALLDAILSSGGAAAAEHLRSIKAQDLLLKCMNLNANNVQLLALIAGILGKISGQNEGGVKAMIDQLKRLVGTAKSGSIDDVVDEITRVVRVVRNMMLMEGAMDANGSKQLSEALTQAVNVLRTHEKTDGVEEAISLCLSTLARLRAVDDAVMDDSELADTVNGIMHDGNYSQSAEALGAACACIGAMANSVSGIQILASKGMVSAVIECAQQKSKVGALSSTNMGKDAAEALEILAKHAISNAVMLVGSEGGVDAIFQILKNILDAKVLGSAIGQIMAAQGGLEALVEVLTRACSASETDLDKRLITAIVKAILAQRDSTGVLANLNKQAHVAAVTRAAGLYMNSAILFENNCESLEGALLLVSVDGALETICNLVKCDNEATATAAMIMLAKIIGFNDPLINEKLKKAAAGLAVSDGLKKYIASEEYVQNALFALRSLVDTIGVEGLQLTKEIMRIVQDTIYKHSSNEYIRDTASSFLQELTAAFATGIGALLEDRLRNFHKIFEMASAWQEVVAADGRVYYYNTQTGQTSWVQSPEHAALVQELDAVVHLIDSIGDIKDLDLSTATALLGLIGTHARDRRVVQRVTHVLNAQCADPAQARLIAEQPRVSDLVPVMALHSDNVDMLTEAASILDNLSQFQKFKEALSSLEYITVINNTIKQHVGVEALVHKGLRTLGHLAFNNPTNIGFCMLVNVPATCKLAVQSHLRSAAVTDAVVYCLTNLLLGSDQNKISVCNTCSEEILRLATTYMSDAALFIKILRFMGVLSAADHCIVMLVRLHATTIVVNGMKMHEGVVDVNKTALEVLSNFGAIDNEDLDSQVTEFLINEKALHQIRDTLRIFKDVVEVLRAGYEALYNIGNDEEAADVLVEIGLVETTLHTIQQYEYDTDLLRNCVKFMSVMTYTQQSVHRFSRFNGVQVLKDTIESKIDSGEVGMLADAALTLSNSFREVMCRTSLEEINGMIIFLQLLDLYDDNEDMIRYVVTALTRLAAADSLSKKIAEGGMHLLMKCLTKHIDNTVIISLIFEMFGQLAFVKDNLKVIVQHGGIKILLDTMNEEDMSKAASLMVKTIRTLDNIASADEEYATIVIERGGIEAVDHVMKLHPHDAEIQSNGERANLSMAAMARLKEREGTKTNRGALAARLGEMVDVPGMRRQATEPEPEGDPISEHRNLLTAGQMVNHFEFGSSLSKQLFASTDFQAIIVKDPRKGKERGGVRLPLNKVKEVRRGHGPHHLKKGLFGAPKPVSKEDTSIYICGLITDDDICVECQNAIDRERWFSAIDRWLYVYRTWPNKLLQF